MYCFVSTPVLAIVEEVELGMRLHRHMHMQFLYFRYTCSNRLLSGSDCVHHAPVNHHILHSIHTALVEVVKCII